MKKMFYMMSLIMMCLFLNACTIGHGINKFEALKLTIDTLEYSEQPKINYFDNANDLVKLNSDLVTQYDKTYFKEHSLILITLKDNIYNEYKENGIKNGSIAINRQVVKESELTNWTLILEIEDKIPDIENFIVHFNDSEKQVVHTHNYQENVINPTCQEQGYIQYKCECGDSYKDNYTEIVECVYEDGNCIWCEKDECITLYDHCYIGIEVATTYEYFVDDYHLALEINDGELYWAFDNYGKFEKVINESTLFDLSGLNILEGYEEIISKINNTKQVYYMTNETSPRINTNFYLVNDNNDSYLIIKRIEKESGEIDSISINLLDDSRVLLHFNDINTRIGDEVYKYVNKNENYVIDFLDITSFDSDMFIDLETLSIYKGTINSDKHMKLVPYSEEEGVYYTAIVEYIFQHGKLHFKSQIVEKEELEKFNNVVYDGASVILELDNIKYTLLEYLGDYYIYNIEMNTSIFDAFEIDDEVLSKLFGLNNLDYNVNDLVITKNNNGYVIGIGIDYGVYD